MIRRLLPLLAFALLAVAPARAAFDHSLLDALLREHVAAGLVNYEAVRDDERLPRYLAALAAAEPSALDTRAEQLAFWINTYNAYTLELIARRLPLKSIQDIREPGAKTPWDIPLVRAAGRTLTLNQVEHDILRAELKEPRIHYAIVCAALSCPPLRSEAFTAGRLEEQLDEQGRVFVERFNRFDLAKRHAELSSILDWFGSDFGADRPALLRALAAHAPAPLAASLRESAEKWTVGFQPYDWTLNRRP